MANKPVSEILRKIPLGIRLPRYLIGWLNEQETSNAVLIEKALNKMHDIKPPIKN